ncbi:MAG: carbohydrate ABC transporter permease [Marmoricola sp.]
MSNAGSRVVRRSSRTLTGLVIFLLFAIPLAYVVMISLESSHHFLSNPLKPPTHAAFENFGTAWRDANLATEIVNTVIYSVISAVLSTVLSMFIAVPVARSMVRWSRLWYTFVVVGVFLPFAAIPLFVESQYLHLYNNRIGYILLHIETGMPLGVILITAFMFSVPKEIDEAAWLDGAGYFRYLRSVVVPLIWPSLLITFLYALLGVWNDIIGPVVFLADPDLFPVTRGIFNFYGQNESAWTVLAAAVILVSLPVVVLFGFTQRHLMHATTGAAVKA